MSKIVIIGIDGGTFDIIDPLIRKRELPNIESIMKNGCWSELTTTIPSITLPAWVSFATGVNPAKHGIYYFTADTHKTYDEGPLVNTTNIRAKHLWQILTENDKKCIAVTIPFTYPPMKVDGAMVSFPARTGQIDKFRSYPPEIMDELKRELKLDQKNIESLKQIMDNSAKGDASLRVVDLHQKAVEIITDATLYLMEKLDWSFLMTVYQSSDVMQHHFWAHMDKDHPYYKPENHGQFSNVIFDTYRKIDASIGRIMKKAGNDTTFIIMSDHGGAPVHKYFFTNKWLMEKGWLVLNGKRPYKISIKRRPVGQVLERVGMKGFTRFLPYRIKTFKIPCPKRRYLPSSELIDWGRTKAYATNAGININLKDREPNGIVEAKEYDKTLESIRNELYKYIDPQTGKKVIDKVFRRDEIYHGPYLEDAYDLYFTPERSLYLPTKALKADYIVEPLPDKEMSMTAHHYNCMKGIFMIQGPNINGKNKPDRPKIIDILPTVLYLMGIKIPDSLDGRVLQEIMSEDYLRDNPVEFSSTEPYEGHEATSNLEQEEDEIRQQLKNLGYI
jgi:predicted AlkP superfamily phosphohydrolase/phosphomutase